MNFSRVLWLLCLCLLMPLAQAKTVKIGIEPRAPLFSITEDGSPAGLYVDLLRDLTNQHDWILQFIPGKTSDLLNQLRSQSLDMVVGISADDPALIGFDVLEPPIFVQWHQIYRPQPSLWQRWTEPRWSSLQNLSYKRLGVVGKSPAHQASQQFCQMLLPRCNIVVFESMGQMLTSLRNQQIDAIAVDTVTAKYHQLAFHADASALTFLPLRIHIAVDKNTPAQMKAAISETLMHWQRDRTLEYERLVNKSNPLQEAKVATLPLQYLVVGLGCGLLLGFVGIIWAKYVHKTKPVIISKEDLDHECRRYQVLINSIPHGLQEVDLKGRIVFSNAEEHQIRRYKFGELVGRSIFDMMAFEREKKELREYFKTILKEQPQPGHYHCTVLRKDGELAELRVEWNYKRDPHGNINGFFGLVSDVTETEQVKQRILEQQKNIKQVAKQRTEDLKQAYTDLLMAATVFEQTKQGILVLNLEGQIDSANPAFLSLSGYEEEELRSLTLKDFAATRHGPKFHTHLETHLKTKSLWQGEFWLQRKNNKVYPNWVSINAVLDADENTKQYVALFTDISRLKKAEQQIWRQAHYDNLTNLPNRNLFYQRLSQTVDNKKQRAAIMFIDLDRFKEVNDTLGHDAGDELLKQVAVRLQKCLTKEDMVARMGGDEFTVIIAQIQGVTQIENIAQNILKVLATPFPLAVKTVNISGSVGIVIFPDQADNMTTLLKNADIAMYQAKESGRDAFRIFKT